VGLRHRDCEREPEAELRIDLTPRFECFQSRLQAGQLLGRHTWTVVGHLDALMIILYGHPELDVMRTVTLGVVDQVGDRNCKQVEVAVQRASHR